MRKIYLVSCVSEKQEGMHPAKDLYQSDLFKKSRAFVEQEGAEWFILSAEYGLLLPDRPIQKYDKTLNKMPVLERRKWASKVLNALQKVLKPSDEVVFLAGMKYREFLMEDICEMGVQVRVPMEGLKIGKQLSWLKQRVG